MVEHTRGFRTASNLADGIAESVALFRAPQVPEFWDEYCIVLLHRGGKPKGSGGIQHGTVPRFVDFGVRCRQGTGFPTSCIHIKVASGVARLLGDDFYLYIFLPSGR
jgi:hypothetical protein